MKYGCPNFEILIVELKKQLGIKSFLLIFETKKFVSEQKYKLLNIENLDCTTQSTGVS